MAEAAHVEGHLDVVVGPQGPLAISLDLVNQRRDIGAVGGFRKLRKHAPILRTNVRSVEIFFTAILHQDHKSIELLEPAIPEARLERDG
jgi:hypothetical protein